MKEINDLDVQVTYCVNLSNLVVPDIVYEQLCNSDEFGMLDAENEEAYDWLLSKIHEDDAHDWTVEIVNMVGE